jgi:hypothetical protein
VSQRFFSAAVVMIVAALLLGCMPALKSIKPSSEAGDDSDLKKPRISEAGTETGEGTERSDQSVVTPPQKYEPPPPPPDHDITSGAIDLRKKDEINAAALKFAKNASGKNLGEVKHVKTCYSKLYGGWYLMLYVKKGKKIALQQYSWNDKSREWEIIYYLKEVPPDRLDIHLKGEIADEKCFVLK